uniref:Uncharacterized protein n=1 Tax=Eutreptiella gymnastica TaxID=73025 RepID=A0A7S1IER6_9EUGL
MSVVVKPVPLSLYKSRYPKDYPDRLQGSVWTPVLYDEIVRNMNILLKDGDTSSCKNLFAMMPCGCCCVTLNRMVKRKEQCDDFVAYINARPDVHSANASLSVAPGPVQFQKGVYTLPCLYFSLGVGQRAFAAVV